MIDSIQPRYPKRLIVPLDGSNAADLAAPIAAEIAARAGIPVSVVHIFDNIRSLAAAAESEISWTGDAEPRATIRPIASIRDAVDHLVSAGLEVEVVGRVGGASQELVKEIARFPDAWVVMSSLGESGIRSLFLGSTARAIIRSSRQPVLLVPASRGDSQALLEPDSGRLAVFLDGGDAAEQAICDAAAVAETMKMELDVVRVAETFRDDDSSPSVDDVKWETAALNEVETFLIDVGSRCRNVRAVVNPISLAGSPEVQLTQYVRERLPAMVVLATRKRSGIERWTYGSLAERLVGELPVPLLLTPVNDR